MAMFSYGAFVVGAHHDEEKIPEMVEDEFFTEMQRNVNLLGLCFTGAVLYSFVAFYYMRKRLYMLAEELNAKSLTPADYCVMIRNCDFDDNGSEESILAEVKEVFENRYNLGNKV